MQDSNGKVLYVGKARNLKKRVSSYFQKRLTNARLVSLIKQIKHIEIIVTRNESEALILENQLIKKFRPRYNILLRDDKSYPYIVLSDHVYPRLFTQRGERHHKGQFFGPYPNSQAMYETMDLMQKIFRLRTCRDIAFQHRTRPCLLHQIKRCTAPCVGYITQENYQRDVQNAMLLLSGKNQEVLQSLVHRMEQASASEQYEQAAMLRDQIASLRHIQTQQVVDTNKGDSDIFAIVTHAQVTAVEVLSIRNGQLLGNQTFFPHVPALYTQQAILAAFIPQYYLQRPVPSEIIVEALLDEQSCLADALSQLRGKRVTITQAKRGDRLAWLKMATQTAEQALASRLAMSSHYQERLMDLQQQLQLAELPKRLECFDISHTSGEATVASCVVFNEHGPLKSAYRRFNIRGVAPGDDYAAIRQALFRHYQHAEKPDILFIDGGKGQLTQAESVLAELHIQGLAVIAIAKGVTRKPGFEQLFLSGQSTPLSIKAGSPALHVIQHIRDEAHRFALSGHRRKRAKQRKMSFLENIPGIGPKRRRALLKQLGGLQEVKKASKDMLQTVPGISPALAEKIYQALHI